MDVAEKLAGHLSAAGLVVFHPDTPGGNCFVDMDLPDSPDLAVLIESMGGSPSDVRLGYDYAVVRVTLRGQPHNRVSVRTLADQVYDEFHGLHDQEVQGMWLVSCEAQGPPSHLGRDQKGRHGYSISFELEVRNQTKHRE